MTVATPTWTDEELAATALGPVPENREALGELLARHADHLFCFFALQVRDQALAEDLVQDVFLRVIRARGRFDPTRPFRPWLWAIAHNVARSAHVRRGAPMQSLEAEMGDGPRLDEALPDGHPSPRQRVAGQERHERLHSALAQLAQEHREVILLKFFEDLPCREVARILGVTEGTVWSRTHRALAHLSEILGPEWSPEGGDLP